MIEDNPNRNLEYKIDIDLGATRVDQIKRAIATAALETPNLGGTEITVDSVFEWIAAKMSREQIIELYTKMHRAWDWCRIYKND